MNEVDWLGGSQPAAMLDYLAGKPWAGERKLRLFACACVRLRWEDLFFHSGLVASGDPAEPHRGRLAVAVAERYAEGEASDAELEEARARAEQSVWTAPQFQQPTYQAAHAATLELASEAARQARDFIEQQVVGLAVEGAISAADGARERAKATAEIGRLQGALLVELFGNPFRPVRIDPAWLRVGDGAAGAVLRDVCESGRFAELPYLADALMDAGCGEEALLRHLREPGGHARGCWALDALAGR